MSTLSFDQKRTLVAFERFFGDKYNTHADELGNTSMHVETQKMCYLLKMAGYEIGDFDYSWNFKGPFSPGLLVLLRKMDRNDVAVKEFYENTAEKETFLFGFEKKIDELREKLEINKHQGENEKWIEILGSLTYISRTILPGESFEKVNQRLIQEKSQYCDMDVNRHAWELLKGVNLLTTMD